MHAVAHVLRRIIPEAEQRADRNWRRQKLVSDIDGLEVSPQIVEKLLEGGYDKLYKLTVATSYELQEDDLLTQDEVRQVNDVLHNLGFEGLRPDDTTMITRLLNLWGSWAHVPTEIRKFYEQ